MDKCYLISAANMSALIAWNVGVQQSAPGSEENALLWLYNKDKSSREKIKSLGDIKPFNRRSKLQSIMFCVVCPL